ncbi:flavoprotein [Fulvitalea axinellae]|uniref:Flavoprotein n=1 Tax=Fulvitalea axinellae TaxID=1182444 RepID=A0AAU9DE14_9BACT|nr:flavoprotein [Fulvitalea axinellae]
MYDLIIVGGGAAGYFAAAELKSKKPEASVLILEKSGKTLAKVLVSGGGRCNVTNAEESPAKLVAFYPRGGKSLRKVFDVFGTAETKKWFGEKGVRLKTEADGRVFPVSDNSRTIIECLRAKTEAKGVKVKKRCGVKAFGKTEAGFKVQTDEGEFSCRKLLVATGGANKEKAYAWLADAGLTIKEPLPSLFTLNVPDSGLKGLEGVSMPSASVRLAGTKEERSGAILVTHWGVSGPAVLRLSAYASPIFHEKGYKCEALVNWWADKSEDDTRAELTRIGSEFPKKLVRNTPLFDMPTRLWERLVELSGIEGDRRWLDLSKKMRNRLVEHLVRFPLKVSGKTTFKEEFVTCGGVALNEVNLKTMESKKFPGLYLAGEVLDVDGVTGGFNFQFAWSSGYLAGTDVASKL